MAADILQTALGAFRLAVLFVTALSLPLLIPFLLLAVAGAILWRLVRLGPLSLVLLLFMVGVPIHEFSHALAALVTLSGVAAIKPLSDEHSSGFVQPRRSHCLAKVVTSLAPLLGGILVLWLTATYIIPGFSVASVSAPQLDLESAGSLCAVLQESMDYLARFLQTVYHDLSALEWANWRTWIGLYIAVSVGIGIFPSGQDLRILLTALPLSFLAVLALFAWLYVSGDAESAFQSLQAGLLPHILNLARVIACAFVLVSFGALLLLPLALIWRQERAS